MAISKATLREMRENSAAGAARQRAKEQAALEKYMDRRNKEVADMMSTKEKIALVAQGKNEGLSDRQISEKYGIPLGSINRLATKAKEQGLIHPSGVIDAAELSEQEREQLTAEVEAAAGMADTSAVECAVESGDALEVSDVELDVSDVYDGAKRIMEALRKVLNVPEYVDVNLSIINGLYELEVKDSIDNDIAATLTWRIQ